MLHLRKEQETSLARSFTAAQLDAELRRRGLETRTEADYSALRFRDAEGAVGVFRLDDRGRLAGFETPAGRSQKFRYDEKSRLTGQRSSGLAEQHWIYNDQDLLTDLYVGREKHWRFDWNKLGGLETIHFPDGTRASLRRDASYNVTGLTDRCGASTEISRDETDRITSIRDANGHETRYAYRGKASRPHRITRADGTFEVIERDRNGRIARVDTNDGAFAAVEWVGPGQLRKINYRDGTFVEFEYSAEGHVVEARTRTSLVRRTYDASGRLLSDETDGVGFRFEYNATGLLSSIALPNGETIRYGYDGDARVTEIEDWNGRRHLRTYPDASTFRHRYPNGATTSGTLGPNGRFVQLTTQGPARTEIASRRCEYDANDRLISALDASGAGYRYAYDGEGRLQSVVGPDPKTSAQYSYDGSGNRTLSASGSVTEPAMFNSMNRLVRHSATSLQYDTHGNLCATSRPDGTWCYRYDARNQLIGIDGPNGLSIAYGYDAFGRRIWKDVAGIRTRYYWAGEMLLAEARGRDRTDYLYFPDSFCPLVMRSGSGSFFFHHDDRGVPEFLTDEAGQIAWSITMSAFGAGRPTGRIAQPWRLPGQYFDEESGLHYNRARYYAPELGRYLSPDPLDISADLNVYVYCNNDPINQCDPLGLLGGWAKIALAATAVVVGAAVCVVAAPIVIGATAITATVVAAAAAFVVGAGAIGAGVALALAPDGCAECQKKAMLSGFIAGAGVGLFALTMLMGGPLVGGGLAIAGGGTAGGGAALITQAGAAVAVALGIATTGGGGGGSDHDDGDDDDGDDDWDEDDRRQRGGRGEKGKSFRGGSKSQRDNWYGKNDKDFQQWWHREGKAANGGRDIENAEQAEEMYKQWEGLGKPRVK